MKIIVQGEMIRLGQFLKMADIVASGGEAKMLVQAGEVKVNGVIEKRRGLQLREGDLIEAAGRGCTVSYQRTTPKP